MALKHKIMLLLGFIGIITVIVAVCFVHRLTQHVDEFKASVEQDKVAFEVSQQRSLQELEKKTRALKNEVKEHVKRVEAGILGDPQAIKDFYEDFSQKQDQLFDKINRMNSSK